MRNFKQLAFLFLSLCLITMFASCSDDENNGLTGKPTVEFEMSEYKVKVGKDITLEAKVENAVKPIYSWKLNGKIISINESLVFDGEAVGEYFITLRVDAENGAAEAQVKVSVLDKLPPEITMPSALVAYSGEDTEFTAEVLYAEDDATYLWRLNGQVVSETNSYVFKETAIGPQSLTLRVTNEDGVDLKTFTVNVLPPAIPELFFDDGHYRVASNIAELRKMTVPFGKSLVLAPVICNIKNPSSFTWTVNGTVQSSTIDILTFTPTAKGTYRVIVKENSTSATAEVEVTCTEPEGTYFRPVSNASKATAATAFDFIPAPGQFIDYQIGTTKAQALQKLQTSLNAGGVQYIGAYGGYWIVGFDHSVENVEGKADLAISGNAFPGWSEPGIVWVMQDENGNGLPDDTWYELAGSEANKAETKTRYALTYYKPKSSGSNVLWTDNLGQSGSVDYIGSHTQAYYYPMFVLEDKYTVVGTCLGAKIGVEGGIETTKDYPWGYVDNYNTDPAHPASQFFIEDAMDAAGNPVKLKYIDFVKVHTGAVGKGAAVGEISTEPGIPTDMNFKK
ncbi:MAG: hypothetical protein LBN74_08040 [Prevotella sp.]|jgi:hypothetical protein|nr:hypothetical protein [Prevotella sp.]